MFDFDVIAYTMLGISSSVSALQIVRWILNANPRTVIQAGRWSAAALIGLTPVVLLWLVMSGRSTLAMMLAAFVLPVIVQGGLHWRGLFGPLNFQGQLSSLGPGFRRTRRIRPRCPARSDESGSGATIRCRVEGVPGASCSSR